MAADDVSWVFDLVDRVTGPARGIAAALDKISDASGGAMKAFGSFISAADHAINVMERLGRVVVDAGKFALNAASFREDTSLALEVILRSKQEADDVMNRAIAFAAKTPFKTTTIMDFVKQFMVAGFGKNDTFTLMQALTDLGAMKGMNTERMQLFADHLVRINSMGKLTQHELTLLSMTGIIPMNRAFEGLSRVTGLTADTLRGRLKQGAIDSTTAIRGILQAMADMGGGKLGDLTARGSRTLSGLWSTLISRPEELLMGLANSPVYDRIKQWVGGLADLLDPNSSSGKRIVESINDLVSTIGDGLSAFGEGFSEAIPSLKDFFAQISAGMGGMSGFKTMMGDLGFVIGETAKGLGYLVELLGKAASLWSQVDVKSAMKDTGWDDPLTGIGSSLKRDFGNLMNWRMGLPGHAEGGLVTSPHMAMVGERGPELIVPLNKLGGMGGGTHIGFTINATASSQEHAQSIGDRARDVVLTGLSAAFEEVALETGVG